MLIIIISSLNLQLSLWTIDNKLLDKEQQMEYKDQQIQDKDQQIREQDQRLQVTKQQVIHKFVFEWKRM